MQWFEQRVELGDWLKTLEYPTGVLCANDLCGTRLLEAARLAHISVPEQVAVVGVDNDPVLCSMAWPPLSRASSKTPNRLASCQRNSCNRCWTGTAGRRSRRGYVPKASRHAVLQTSSRSGEPDLVAAIQYIRSHACPQESMSTMSSAACRSVVRIWRNYSARIWVVARRRRFSEFVLIMPNVYFRVIYLSPASPTPAVLSPANTSPTFFDASSTSRRVNGGTSMVVLKGTAPTGVLSLTCSAPL